MWESRGGRLATNTCGSPAQLCLGTCWAGPTTEDSSVPALPSAVCQGAFSVLQGAVEPMQIDVDPQEDPQNAPDINYVVENPTLVRIFVRGELPSLGSVEGSDQTPHCSG